MASKFNFEDRIDDRGLDLSLCELKEVPAEVANISKSINAIDLSNNLLTSLPVSICTLIFIQKLDLSKNKLKELPQDFGNLINLRTLDLYQNELTYLPLSFANLRKLRWLDVSNNPLPQALIKVIGYCTNEAECNSAARNIVKFFSVLEKQMVKNFSQMREAKLSEDKPSIDILKEVANKKPKKNKKKANSEQKQEPKLENEKSSQASHNQSVLQNQSKVSNAKSKNIGYLRKLVPYLFIIFIAIYFKDYLVNLASRYIKEN